MQIQQVPLDDARLRDQLLEEKQKTDLKKEEQEKLKQKLGVKEEVDVNEDIAKLTEDTEKDLLFHVLSNMKDRKISVEESRRLANDFLVLLPMKDKTDLLDKLKRLSNRYPEAQAVYLKYASPHEENEKQKILDQMAQHIKNGNIEEAINVAKGGNQ